jgi:signal transduction histidine kinase
LNRTRSGTGIGLPLTKRLVEMHGGTLDLASQPGVGTTVTVRFPASRLLDAETQLVA